jgi:hypothetical protein
MSAVSAPFGFRPADNPIHSSRAQRYVITGAYNTAMYQNQPVILNTNGTVTVGTAAADLLGVFAGCEYYDATGKYNVSPFWPASQAIFSGTTAYAWIVVEPNTVFEVQADGPVAQTAIGDQADVTNISNGSTLTGLSQCTLASSLAGAGVQGQWRIIGFGGQPDNLPGDAFTIVQVQLARSQYVANKVAI